MQNATPTILAHRPLSGLFTVSAVFKLQYLFTNF